MLVDVKMKDGRTTFRFAKRGDAIALMKRSVLKLEEFQSVRGWAQWHPDNEEWAPCQLQAINPQAVSFVREVDGASRAAFVSSHKKDTPQKGSRA